MIVSPAPASSSAGLATSGVDNRALDFTDRPRVVDSGRLARCGDCSCATEGSPTPYKPAVQTRNEVPRGDRLRRDDRVAGDLLHQRLAALPAEHGAGAVRGAALPAGAGRAGLLGAQDPLDLAELGV